MADSASESEAGHNEEVYSVRASRASVGANNGVSKAIDTLGVRCDDEPRRAGVNKMTSVAASSLAAPAVQTPSRLPADEDASNECDTLGLRWGDGPRREEDGIDARAMCYEDAPDLNESGGGSEPVSEPIYPRLGPVAHHILPSDAAALDAPPPGNTGQGFLVHITEANLAEEGVQHQEEVIMGTRLAPPEPSLLSWLNHKKAKLILALLCAVLVVLSVALWFGLSSGSEENIAVKPRSPGTPQSFPPSIAASSPPSSTFSPSSPPSMTYIEGLFEADCKSCDSQVAIDGDTAVVTRSYDIRGFSLNHSIFDAVTKYGIYFFSFSQSSFEIVTQIDIDYRPTAAAIHRNTAVIGSEYENAVYVYERDQKGTWTQAMLIQPNELCRGSKFGCGRSARFGRAIAMDNNVIIIGAPSDGETYQGSVYIYRRNETTWTIEAKLTAPDDSDTAAFGYSVSVKGPSLVVGDPGEETESDNKGAVFGYTFDSLGSSWNPVSRTRMEYVCDWYSFFVRLLDDEELLVACRESYSGFTTVYHYEKPEGGDEYVTKEDIRFDSSVESLAADRTTMVVGEFRAGRSFAIRFFVQNINIWEEVAGIDSSFFDLGFGEAVALSGNITLIASDRNVYRTYGAIMK